MPRRLWGRANTTRPCSIADYTGKTLANPFKPSTAPSFFTFQPDTVTSNLHAGDGRNIQVEARSGDVLNLAIGAVAQVYNSTTENTDIRYQGAMPVRGRAGRDIVNFGRVGYSDQYNKVFPGLIVGADPTDVSIVAAGRNILYLNVQIAGPGSLDVSAGGTVYQGNLGAITSIGPLASGDTRSGASIVVAAGLGSDGADYAALHKYLDAAKSRRRRHPARRSARQGRSDLRGRAEGRRARIQRSGVEPLRFLFARPSGDCRAVPGGPQLCGRSDHVRRLGHPRTVWRRYLDPHSTGVRICLHSDRVP